MTDHSFTRYAVYCVPHGDALSAFGASWLGWDCNTGQPVPQPDIPGMAAATAAPRKYGFHGTLKPPFRVAPGHTADALSDAVATLAAHRPAAHADGLAVTPLGRFLALTPTGDMAQLRDLAAACVTELDAFRAPMTDTELAKRRAAGLSAHQDALLLKWGYPFVLDAFRFHLTLTGRLDRADLPNWQHHVTNRLPDLPRPFVIDSLALCGERTDGQFQVIQRFALTGPPSGGP
ncbi:MAG: DUF1045 domain-containing protein [Pseudomonadota bacterium]